MIDMKCLEVQLEVQPRLAAEKLLYKGEVVAAEDRTVSLSQG
jgi:hypothetical protein